MSALMSAGTTLKQAQVQQHALKKDEGHAGILKAEIEHSVKTDTSAKQAELKETEEHAADLKSKQTDTLEAAATSFATTSKEPVRPTARKPRKRQMQPKRRSPKRPKKRTRPENSGMLTKQAKTARMTALRQSRQRRNPRSPSRQLLKLPTRYAFTSPLTSRSEGVSVWQ